MTLMATFTVKVQDDVGNKAWIEEPETNASVIRPVKDFTIAKRHVQIGCQIRPRPSLREFVRRGAQLDRLHGCHASCDVEDSNLTVVRGGEISQVQVR